MKNLKDVLEKLKVDDIVIEKFPIDGTLDNMVEFLKERNFKEISNDFNNYLYNAFEDAKKKVYLMLDKEIFFADTSKEKISEYNPIFLCSDKGDLNIFYFDFTNNHYIDIVKNGKDNSTKKAFMKELNKRFGWQ